MRQNIFFLLMTITKPPLLGSSNVSDLLIYVLILHWEQTLETSWFTHSAWPNPSSQTQQNILKKLLHSFVCFFCFLNHTGLNPREEHNSIHQPAKQMPSCANWVTAPWVQHRKRFGSEKGQPYETSSRIKHHHKVLQLAREKRFRSRWNAEITKENLRRKNQERSETLRGPETHS